MKTSELTGAALDWAVAKCEGATEEWRSYEPFLWDGVPCIRIGGHDVNYTPSTSWLMGGPIIEREEMCVQPSLNEGAWFSASGDYHFAYGTTPLIAAMRCYIASKLGDEIEIPAVLTQGETR